MTQLSIVKWVEKLLSGCEGTANHTDDIIVHGSDELQYDKRLENVLQILKDNEYLITLKIPDRRSFEYSSFETLKIRLSNLKTLGYYNPVGRTQIIADAFPVGLGAVLVQIDRHGPRIIGFGNKSITDCEKRYCQTEKEALALVWAVEHFKIYLLGKEVELISDHKPLETIYGNRSKPCARIKRWVLRLQTYKYKVVYRSAKENIAYPISFDNENYINAIVEYSRPIAVPLVEI
ncbi:unnamed protein product [Pieris macdunnoughi]|uniref:Reverse transcriptase RNase H-like domain-containing protein n=1 Tax=Pieris macdunnoughi TaxID=345717 RepID=A0A821Y005_9NEOP|nr:unnamed protein product [Pieris macdunnoughi]